MASRIFVRSLPPSINEDDFRSHFSQRFPSSITDIKLFPQRRIGYVGLRTPEDAQSAIKYFNKTFIRMSRIAVELATAPDIRTTPTARKATPAKVLQEEPVGAKRKRAEADDHADKRMKAALGEEGVDAAQPVDPEKQESPVDGEAHAQSQQEQQPPTSDIDWMRSKTSRLLGLVDDEEEEKHNHPSTEVLAAPSSEQTRQRPASEQPSQQPTPPPEGLENTAVTINEDVNSTEDQIRQTGRLFLRNLPYTTQEEDLRKVFASKGSLEEVHVPLDPKTGQAKGFAFALFNDHEEAVQAFSELDGSAFQGRLVHILPAAAKKDHKLDEFAISKLSVKKQRQIQRKGQAASGTFNWNSLYMNADAVNSSIAARLGVAKSELFDPTSADAAVKQAQAETHVIQETKAFFEQNGINLDAFKSKERGDLAILVKNFPYGTTQSELRDLFAEFGSVTRVILPPSGTIAIVEFDQRTQARAAFSSLAYCKFKSSMLFLEKAPKDLFTTAKASESKLPPSNEAVEASKPSTSDLFQPGQEHQQVDTTSLFVKNLNFATTQQRFEEAFKPLDGFLSARLKTKIDAKRGDVLSMGFGFLEFRTTEQAKAAMLAMNGYTLDNHQLVIRGSHKGSDAAEERRKDDQEKRRKARKSKIIIKNLPFEASKRDVRALFKSYGQLRSIRVPKKFDGSRKGFAFAEFTTPKEAENAMDALRNTHLLGRRLVLDYAAGEADDAEKEIEEMQKKVGQQVNSIALQRLTKGSERKKFTLGDGNEDGVEG